VTKIRSTLFHHKLSFFDCCIATKVWTSCDWNLVNNFPPWNVFQFYFFGHCIMTRVWIGCNWKSWSLGWQLKFG
jgi:hypothetical protein